MHDTLSLAGTIEEICILLKESWMFPDYMEPWDSDRLNRGTASQKHGVASLTKLPILFFA